MMSNGNDGCGHDVCISKQYSHIHHGQMPIYLLTPIYLLMSVDLSCIHDASGTVFC
jgi:hypothetical protein